MYNLPYYKEKNEEAIVQFIADNPFAFLSGCDAEQKPVATQVPVFLEEEHGKKLLRGHIMKGTDHYNAFLQNPNVLVVFTGAHAYVSATWYSDPHNASTWNYMSVHAKGIIRYLDEEGLTAVLRKTSLHFEQYNEQSTTVFDNLGEAYTRPLMKAIVAFEIEITGMDHVFKLSQDRDEESYESIKENLRQGGGSSALIAGEMDKRNKELFPSRCPMK